MVINLSPLEKLTLSHITFGEVIFSKIFTHVMHQLSSLTYLDISNNELFDDYAEHLDKYIQFRFPFFTLDNKNKKSEDIKDSQLISLDISNNNFT